MQEFEIKCKKCGKYHFDLYVETRVKFNFKCKRCKTGNMEGDQDERTGFIKQNI